MFCKKHYNRGIKDGAGFTVVEMMLVIAILSTLAAIIMPLFFKVREASAQTVCSANLKQLGSAFFLYSQDWNGFWPAPGGLVGDRSYWSQSGNGGLNYYIHQRGLKSVWCCPLLTEWNGKYPARSYCMNSYLREPLDADYPSCINFLRGANTYKIMERRRTVLLFEGIPLGSGWEDKAYTEDKIYYIYRCANWAWSRGFYSNVKLVNHPKHTIDAAKPWHGRRNNYLYCDGHVIARPPGGKTSGSYSTYDEMYQWYVDKPKFRRKFSNMLR